MPDEVSPVPLRSGPGLVASVVGPAVRIGCQSLAGEPGILPKRSDRGAGQPELHYPADRGNDHGLYQAIAEQDAVGPATILDPANDDLPEMLWRRLIYGRDPRIGCGDTGQCSQQAGRAAGGHARFLRARFAAVQDF